MSETRPPAAMSDYQLADWLSATGFPQAEEAAGRLRRYHDEREVSKGKGSYPEPIDLTKPEPPPAPVHSI